MTNSTSAASTPAVRPVLTRLIPLDPPQLEEGFMVHIGNSSFYVRHLRDGLVINHTQQQWQTLFAGAIQELVETLQTDNPQFDPDQMSELNIPLSGRVSYKTFSDPHRSIMLQASAKALTALAAVMGNQSTPLDANTVAGRFDQARSQLVLQNPNARHACTMIDSVFAEFALVHTDSAFLTPDIIDGAVIQGQTRFIAIRPQIEEAVKKIREDAQAADEADPLPDGQAFINFDSVVGSCPLLIKGQMRTRDLSAANTQADFNGTLLQLSRSSHSRAVFGGITSRGDSFGVVIYKNAEQEVEEVVYFDSHSRLANGTPHACAKKFKTIAEAASFLAHRNPFEADAAAHRNQFTMTQFRLDLNLQNFLNARQHETLIEDYRALKPVIRDAIAAITENDLTAGRLARVTGEEIFYHLLT